MNQDTRDYLNNELHFFEKAYEIQFTHFMGVFYFWTIVVTAPVTAGLLATKGIGGDLTLSILLLLVAFLGWFLAAKMFDIRCSQLRYISMINQVRWTLYQDVKKNLPKSYVIPFVINTNVRKTAFTDFGMSMAIAMSALDAILLGFALPFLLQDNTGFNWWAFTFYFIFGFATYLFLVITRVPKPPKEQK